MGTIYQVVENADNCRAFIKLNYYRPSQLCPLYVFEIEQEGIVLAGSDCSQLVNKQISGVIARIDGQLVID